MRGRYYWFGGRKGWRNPLARIYSPRGACGDLGGQALAALGFEEVDAVRAGGGGGGGGGERLVPVLTWCDRHSARGFEGAADEAVLLRQLPACWLDALDDKRQMHELLLGEDARPGSQLKLPATFLAEDFLPAAVGPAAGGAGGGGAWYTKHARGIKGNQVDRHSSAAAARAWLDTLPAELPAAVATAATGVMDDDAAAARAAEQREHRTRHPGDHPVQRDYVVQREVPPLLLADRRRFCIRQHVLLVLPPPSDGGLRPRGYSHRDLIMLPHSVPDTGDDGGSDGGKAAHVQQVGKRHPTPSLLANADSARGAALQSLLHLPAGVDAGRATAQLEGSARVALERFCEHVAGERAAAAAGRQAAGGASSTAPGCVSSWYYNLFGFDQVLEAGTGDAVLLEVNVYPALAGGTMGAVPRAVYSRLVDDTLQLLAPILDADGAEEALRQDPSSPWSAGAPPPTEGGFVDLHIRAGQGDVGTIPAQPS
eukprot:SAG22_NODE_197_length_15520_cov_116.311264_9_plen_483_part_00